MSEIEIIPSPKRKRKFPREEKRLKVRDYVVLDKDFEFVYPHNTYLVKAGHEWRCLAASFSADGGFVYDPVVTVPKTHFHVERETRSVVTTVSRMKVKP